MKYFRAIVYGCSAGIVTMLVLTHMPETAPNGRTIDRVAVAAGIIVANVWMAHLCCRRLRM